MKLLTTLFLFAFVGFVVGVEPAVPGNTPTRRLDANDAGIILRHGDGPNQCDINGAREPTLIVENGKYHLFYDGGGPKGWLACLATSSDLKTWTKHGPVLDFGQPGEPDAGAALSPKDLVPIHQSHQAHAADVHRCDLGILDKRPWNIGRPRIAPSPSTA